MQLISAKSMLHTLLLTAGAVVVCLLYPGLSNAASPTVDVCHREGNGSFHLITVADQAVEAHRAHGDALPGEAVPGLPGYRFTAICAEELASWCPCDFSLPALAAVGIVGISWEDWCLQEGAESVEIRESRTIKDPQALMLARTQECAIFRPTDNQAKLLTAWADQLTGSVLLKRRIAGQICSKRRLHWGSTSVTD